MKTFINWAISLNIVMIVLLYASFVFVYESNDTLENRKEYVDLFLNGEGIILVISAIISVADFISKDVGAVKEYHSKISTLTKELEKTRQLHLMDKSTISILREQTKLYENRIQELEKQCKSCNIVKRNDKSEDKL